MTRRPTPGIILVLAALSAPIGSGCGGGGAVTGPTRALVQVAGTYATAVALTQDSCGGTTVEPRPTVIAHVPGETRLTLTHAALVCPGTVSADGRFVTDPVLVSESTGTSTVGIAGRFSTTGFDADTTVDVARAGASACRYVVHWTGTKQGPPNVLQ